MQFDYESLHCEKNEDRRNPAFTNRTYSVMTQPEVLEWTASVASLPFLLFILHYGWFPIGPVEGSLPKRVGHVVGLRIDDWLIKRIHTDWRLRGFYKCCAANSSMPRIMDLFGGALWMLITVTAPWRGEHLGRRRNGVSQQWTSEHKCVDITLVPLLDDNALRWV